VLCIQRASFLVADLSIEDQIIVLVDNPSQEFLLVLANKGSLDDLDLSSESIGSNNFLFTRSLLLFENK
jgi:hypothetical protein